MASSWWHRLFRWVRQALALPVALLILFEEWGWEPLHRWLARLGQWPPLRALESAIARLPPYAALAVFALPALALLPVKLLALWALAHGQRLLGLTVIVLAKLLGTAVLARLFTLTQPALMRLAWFARLYARWTVWKAGLLAWVRAAWAWRIGRVLKRRARHLWAQWRRASA